jgi:hypothetical protein
MPENVKKNYRDLTALSKRGVLGDIIPEHRALFRSNFSRLNWLAILFLPILFNYVVFESMTLISQIWATLFEFWVGKIEMPGKVLMFTTKLANREFQLPELFIATSAPSAQDWWLLALIAVALFVLMYSLPKNLMPLSYIIGFLALIMLSSLIYFSIMPAKFSYTVSGYLNNLTISAIWLMLVIPWIHALIYYIFDFSFFKKALLTIITLVFIILALPFQLLVQAVILVKYSIIVLPVLNVFFGLFLLILCCLSLYGWAMSWERYSRL